MARLAYLLILLSPGLASAVFLPIDVDSCHNLASSLTSCNVVTRPTASGLEDGARDCLATATQGFACRFAWPVTDPASLTPTIWWGTKVNGSTSGNACFGVKITCCTGNNCAYENGPFGDPKFHSAALDGGYATTELTRTTFSAAVSPNAHAAGALCWMWVGRVQDQWGCDDDIPDANGSGVSIKRIDLQ